VTAPSMRVIGALAFLDEFAQQALLDEMPATGSGGHGLLGLRLIKGE